MALELEHNIKSPLLTQCRDVTILFMTDALDKQTIRKALLDVRLSLNAAEVKKYSEIILNTLSNKISWKDIDTLHVYQPLQKYNEVNTENLIRYIRKNYSEIKVVTASKEKDAMVASGNTYDLVIVPVVGFDRRGYRLGYGGGYYDKFLASNKCGKIIGLAYSFSETERIPNEAHDIKMDVIITEKEIIRIS